MPTFNIFSNKAAIQENLIDNLASMFQTIQGRYRLSPGDFPQLEKAQVKLVFLALILFTSSWLLVLIFSLNHVGCSYCWS